MKFAYFFFAATLFLTLKVSGQNKYLERIEAELIKGKYKEAEFLCKSTINRYKSSKENTSDLAICYAQLAEARYGLAKFSSIDSLLDLSILTAGLDQNVAQLTLLRGANIYLKYGNTLLAQDYLERAVKISHPKNDRYIQLCSTKLLAAQGYNNGAMQKIANLKDIFKSEVIKKTESISPRNGKNQVIKLSKFDQQKRKIEYSAVLNLEDELLYLKSEQLNALTSNLAHEKEIKKLTKKKSTAYVDNLYINGLIFSDSGDRFKAIKSFKKVQNLMGKRANNLNYTKSSERFFDINESIIDHYLRYGDRSDAQKVTGKYLKAVNTYTKRNPFYQKRQYLYAQKIQRSRKAVLAASNNIFKILHDSVNVPSNHPLRIHCFEEMSIIQSLRGDSRMIDQALASQVAIASELYPVYSPTFLEYKLRQFAHQVNYSNDLKLIDSVLRNDMAKILVPEIGPNSQAMSTYLETKSRVGELNEDFASAKEYLNQYTSIQVLRHGKKSSEYGMSLARSAALETKSGNYKSAELQYQKSLEVLRSTTGSKSLLYSLTLENLAELYTIQGEFDKAEDLLLKSDKISKKATRSLAVADKSGSSSFIDVYIQTGRYTEAENILKKNIELKEKQFGKSHRELITPLNQLGRLCFIKGNYSEAEKLAKDASNISMKVFSDSSLRYAESQRLFSQIQLAMGNFDKAEEVEQNNLKSSIKLLGDNHISVAESYNQLALIGIYQGKPETTIEDYFNKSRNIIAANLGKESPKYADVSKNLAFYYSESNKLDLASETADIAEEIYRDKIGKKNVYQADILMLEGDILLKKGSYKPAITKYQNAMKLYEGIFGTEHPSYVKAQSKTARTYYIQGDYQKALTLSNITTGRYLSFVQKYFSSLSDREKNNYWSVIKNEFEFYNSLSTKLIASKPELAGQIYNLNLNTKAILLNSSMKVRQIILNSNDELLISLYKDWVRKQEELAASLSLSNEELVAQGINRNLLIKEVESLEKGLVERSSLFASVYETSLLKWQDVAAKLNKGESVIEIIKFRYFDKDFTDSIIYAALTITSPAQKIPDFILIPNGKELEKKHIKYYRNSIRYQSAEHQSYDNFWKPIKSKIPDKSTVFISPDGVYNQINLLTLMNQDGRYAIENNNIILISSSRDLLNRDKQNTILSENRRAVLFGNPEFYIRKDPKNVPSALESLSGAIDEIYQVRSVLRKGGWEASTIINELATEDTVKKLGGPRVFHIATHGFFMEEKSDSRLSELGAVADNPLLRSGIFLTGGGDIFNDNIFELNSEPGILTAYEVMNLDFDDTELVILSACETGLGEIKTGEGVYGLQRAFIVSGAKSIIMSLFKVSDITTQELITKFYTEWLVSGDRRDAFLKAQLYMKETYQYPLYWGAFNMIGI